MFQDILHQRNAACLQERTLMLKTDHQEVLRDILDLDQSLSETQVDGTAVIAKALECIALVSRLVRELQQPHVIDIPLVMHLHSTHLTICGF